MNGKKKRKIIKNERHYAKRQMQSKNWKCKQHTPKLKTANEGRLLQT